eukprot:COSAG02_NODE_30917_length_542_cov_1.835214_1_plen_41_part_01
MLCPECCVEELEHQRALCKFCRRDGSNRPNSLKDVRHRSRD